MAIKPFRPNAPGRSKPRPCSCRFDRVRERHGAFPFCHYRGCRHRRTDRRAGDCARRVPRRGAGTSRTAGGSRRGYSALAQRHRRAGGPWPDRSAAALCGRAGGDRDPHGFRPSHSTHPARGDSGTTLRRALLGDPPRRFAGRAGRGHQGKPRHHAQARHPRGGLCAAPAWPHGADAGKVCAGRTGHRADRRRRRLVRFARPHGRSYAAGFRAPHRLARDPARRKPYGTIPCVLDQSLARAQRASGALSGQGRHGGQCRGDHP